MYIYTFNVENDDTLNSVFVLHAHTHPVNTSGIISKRRVRSTGHDDDADDDGGVTCPEVGAKKRNINYNVRSLCVLVVVVVVDIA